MLSKNGGGDHKRRLSRVHYICTMHCVQCTLEKQCTAHHVIMMGLTHCSVYHLEGDSIYYQYGNTGCFFVSSLMQVLFIIMHTIVLFYAFIQHWTYYDVTGLMKKHTQNTHTKTQINFASMKLYPVILCWFIIVWEQASHLWNDISHKFFFTQQLRTRILWLKMGRYVPEHIC